MSLRLFNMPSLGLQLRQERERRGISLADIAKDTRISTRYLEAIETDDTRTLPHDFFYRSFVRQYSQYLGLSDAEVSAALQLEASSFEKPAPVEPAPAPTRPSFEPTQHLRPYTPAYEFLDDRPTSKRWLAVAGVLLVASVSYLAWDKFPKAPATARESAASQTTIPIKPVEQSPEPISSSAPETSTAIVQATNLGSGNLKITISAKEPTWVRLVADGKDLYVGLLQAGETKAVENASRAELLVGNAGGLAIQQNGKSLPEVGPRGQVRTVVFSPDNYEVKAPATTKTTNPDGTITG